MFSVAPPPPCLQDRFKKKESPNQKYCPDPKAPGIHFTPLHAAVRVNDPKVVDVLLAAGADVAGLDHEGCTALHWAARSNSPEAALIAEALLKKKAKLAAVSKAKLTPLHVCVQCGSSLLLPILAQKEALEDASPGFTPLLVAVSSGKLDLATLLVDAGASLAARDSTSGKTCLLMLAEGGEWDAAAALLLKGDCNIDAQDSVKGRTALLTACSSSSSSGPAPAVQLIRALLDKGASPDLTDADKDTATLVAVRNKLDESLLLALIHASKSLNARNVKKESVFSLCLASGSDALVEGCLSAGADVSTEGPAMMKAALEKKKDGGCRVWGWCWVLGLWMVLGSGFRTVLGLGLGAPMHGPVGGRG